MLKIGFQQKESTTEKIVKPKGCGCNKFVMAKMSDDRLTNQLMELKQTITARLDKVYKTRGPIF